MKHTYVLAADDAVDVETEPGLATAELLQQLQAPERTLEIPGHAADRVVRAADPVEREVEVQLETGTRGEDFLDGLQQLVGKQAVHGEVDRADPVPAVEEGQDGDELFPQHGLATGEPHLVEAGHRGGEPLDLLEAEKAAEGRFARAARRNRRFQTDRRSVAKPAGRGR
jgi:hypothetical protein